MKKLTTTEKLGLSTNTIRRLSQPMTDDKLAQVAGATTSCLVVTRPNLTTAGCQ
jgi:hypothetical protein